MKLKRCKLRLKEQRHYAEYLKCKLAKKAMQNQKLKERLWKNNCGMADRDAEIRRLTDELTSRNYLYGQRVDEITMLQHALENSEYWKDKAIWRNKDKDAEIERLNATIDRTVNAWESRCIEKCDEIKRLNSVIDELIKKGFTYNRQQWSELVHRIQKERE